MSERSIHALIRNLSGSEEPKKLLDRILNAAVAMTSATTGSIILIDKATSSLTIEAARGFADRVVKETRLKIGKGITGWVAANAQTLRVDDVRKDRRYVRLKGSIRSEMASPLILSGKVIGVINVDSTKVASFTEEDEAALESLATLSSRVISDALIHDRLKRRSRQQETLVRIGGELTSLVSPERILKEVTAAAAELVDAKLVTVRLLDASRTSLTLAAVAGGSRDYARESALPVAGSALGSVALTQIPLIIEDISREDGYLLKNVARKEGLKSLLAVPLVTAGRSIGVLTIYRNRRGDFDDDAATIAVGLAGLAAAALENARLFRMVIDADRRIATTTVSAELAHEIRNPLTTVRLLVGLENDSPDRKMILKQLDRVDGLIAKLLGNAPAEHTPYEPVDLDALLDEIVSVSQVKAQARNITIRKTGKAGTQRGDRDQLWQAISNIVENAVAAAKSQVSIRTSCRRKMGITVEDDGAGIAPEISVFDPLVTTKETGVGIGLFSARRIIHEHGGKISHGRSKRLGGASFTITLNRE